MKKQMIGVLAISLVLSLSACQVREEAPVTSVPQTAENQTVAPQTTGPELTQPVSVPEETAQPQDAPSIPEAYAAVIEQYHTAISQRWNGGELMEAGLNYIISDCYLETPLENIGYGIADLDGDGSEELLIGALVEDEFYGKMIFELYTLDTAGASVPVFSGTERNRYYYAGENRFANLGSGAFDESFETTVKYEDGELVDMTYTIDPSDYAQMALTPFSAWDR